MKIIITERQEDLLNENIPAELRRRFNYEGIKGHLEFIIQNYNPCDYGSLGDFIGEMCYMMVVDLLDDYYDIDNVVYSKGIKNLESILESKKNIKNIITKEEKRKDITENVNIPISSMVKIANDNLKNELIDLNESEKKELDSILSIDFEKMKKKRIQLQNQ